MGKIKSIFFEEIMFFLELRQSQWPSNKHDLNKRWLHCNEIMMSYRVDQINGEFLCLSPNIICWDRVTSLCILQPFNSTYLHVLFTQTTNLRILSLIYLLTSHSDELCLRDKTLIDLINDQSLCNILMSHGLRQLNLCICSGHKNLTNLAHLIVDRLPYLEAIQLNMNDVELIEMASIFINGLSKLSFVALSGSTDIYSVYQKEITLCNSNTRAFRMEMSNEGINSNTLLIWL